MKYEKDLKSLKEEVWKREEELMASRDEYKTKRHCWNKGVKKARKGEKKK